MAWIETYTGKRFDLLEAKPGDVCLEDIAASLSKQCRFNGHTRRFYSVAQHSVYVAQHVDRRFRLAALMHDAHEAYVGDLVSPVKVSIDSQIFRDIENVIKKAVEERFEIEWSPAQRDAIEVADKRMLTTERRQLLPCIHEWDTPSLEPFDFTIDFMGPDFAEMIFRSTFADCKRGI